MGLKPRFLADKSAYTSDDQVGRRLLASLVATRQVASCGVTELEILYSARGRKDYAEIFEERRRAFVEAPIDQAVVRRALEVQRELGARGKHRGAGAADLLVAAAAEGAGLTLLHCDHDFDEIEAVTGQPMQLVSRPATRKREQSYVVLIGRDDCFAVTGVVDAYSPESAIENAVQAGLVRPDERYVVAILRRHWRVRE